MSIAQRIENLSPAKRALLERLLRKSEAATRETAPPRTEAERLLCDIWGEVLAVECIGIHDPFLSLGGDSIRAIQISARARKRGLRVAATDCFEHDTIAKLAEHSGAIATGRFFSPSALRPLSAGEEPPLSFGEERLWVAHQLAPEVPLYNTFGGLRVRGPLDPALLERAVTELVARHELLRTSYAMREGRVCRRVAEPCPFAVQIVAPEGGVVRARVAEIIALETARPFDLERAPLLRCCCVLEAPEEWLLIVTAHHVICDAWSMRVLLDELTRLYESFSRGYPSPLEPLSARYVEFARWQRERFQAGEMDADLAWWREELRDAPALHSLPLSRSRPVRQTLRSEVVYFDVGRPVADRVKALARDRGCTLYVTLLTAWHLLLRGRSGASEMMIGTPVSGRPSEELERVVGFFLNTVALRLRATEEWRVHDVLAANQRVAMQAFSHADVPFEQVVAQLGLPRSRAHAPLVQLWFVLQEQRHEDLRCAGLQLELVDLPRTFGPFELALSMEETKAGFRGWLEFATDLFDRPTAEALVADYRRLLAELPAALERRCGSFASAAGGVR
jgi:aryl carrier-like protein